MAPARRRPKPSWQKELHKNRTLQHKWARFYDSNIGKWTSRDPLGFEAGDSNLYRYTNNRPTIAIDPSGLDFIAIGGRLLDGPVGGISRAGHMLVAYFESDAKGVVSLANRWLNKPTGNRFLTNESIYFKFQNNSPLKLNGVQATVATPRPLVVSKAFRARLTNWIDLYDNDSWCAKRKDGGYDSVSVSVIRYSYGGGDGWYFTPIIESKSKTFVKAIWNQMVKSAKKYSFAEQPHPNTERKGWIATDHKFKNWPNSLYSWDISDLPNTNNSNSFARYLAGVGLLSADKHKPYFDTLRPANLNKVGWPIIQSFPGAFLPKMESVPYSGRYVGSPFFVRKEDTCNRSPSIPLKGGGLYDGLPPGARFADPLLPVGPPRKELPLGQRYDTIY